MLLDALASEPQYLDHILPIYLGLPFSQRGTLYVTRRLMNSLVGIAEYLPIQQMPRRENDPIMVASYGDYALTGHRPVVFVEHGSGQTYTGIDAKYDGAYSGGGGRDRTVLFICPGHAAGARNAQRYPGATVAVVGSPKLDRHHLQPPKPRSDPPTVAFAWHADLRFVPEASSAFRHFHTILPMMAESGYRLLGHAHPRIYRQLASFYDRYGIPRAPELDTILDEADLLIVDNSSVGFEFASLDRPVVWLSPPWYRRDVHHGLRFWDGLILGQDVTDPTQILTAADVALSSAFSDTYHDRMAFLDTVYAYRDGSATRRATEAVGAIL